MLQQTEVTELIEDLNCRQDSKSLFYAPVVGVLAIMIVLFGLIMLYSTSSATVGAKYYHAQLKWAIIGLAAMLSVIFIGYKRIIGWTPWLLSLLVVLLIWAMFSKSVKGANRWITIPFLNMNFQPSELAKVLLPLYCANFFSENLRKLSQLNIWTIFTDFKLFKIFLIPLGVVGGILTLVICGHDFGTTILLATVVFSMALCAGLKKHFLILIPIALAALALYIWKCDAERLSRAVSFFNPGDAALRENDGYQLWNSLLALGSGGWTGVGFMNSVMKHRYLPESHTDFILAVVGEELGYIGLLCVIAGYLTFGFFGMKIALNSRSRKGMLLAHAITLTIVLQAAINIGVVSGALPTKGISAPLISYGGSNLLINMIMIGLLISVAWENVPGLTDKWPGRKKQE